MAPSVPSVRFSHHGLPKYLRRRKRHRRRTVIRKLEKGHPTVTDEQEDISGVLSVWIGGRMRLDRNDLLNIGLRRSRVDYELDRGRKDAWL